MCINWKRLPLGALLLASLSLLLFGCGGGSGTPKSTPTKAVTGKVSSYVTTASGKATAKSVAALAGYASGTALPNATVQAFALVNGVKGAKIGQAVSDARGNYIIRIPEEYVGDLFLLGTPPAGLNAQPVRAVLPGITKELAVLPPVMLSLATEMMVQYVEQNLGGNFSATNVTTATLVMEEFFGANFAQVPPPEPGTASSQAQLDLLVMINAFETVLTSGSAPTVNQLVAVNQTSGLIGIGSYSASLTTAINTSAAVLANTGVLPSATPSAAVQTIATTITSTAATPVVQPDLTDTTAPSAPANPVASAVTFSSAALTWEASSDNTAVTDYYVYRNGVFLAAVTGTAYTDSTLAESTTYLYEIKARDAAGNLSAASSLTVTTPAAPAPLTYSISGTIVYNNAPLEGVTTTLAGASTGVVLTDANGNYTFTGVVPGNYTIIPSKPGYVFVPSSSTITIVNANVIGSSFTALLPGSVTGGTTFPDGSVVVVITHPDGSITVQTTYPDGRISVQTTYPDGRITMQTTYPDGSVTVITGFPDGSVTVQTTFPTGSVTGGTTFPDGSLVVQF